MRAAPAVSRANAHGKKRHTSSRRVKEWNRKVYYALKYSLMIGIVVLIVLSALR